MNDDMPTTQELRLDQIQREREEHARAKEADKPAEEHAASRRADKAAYLKEKLAEQESRGGE
jgi:hypothetical protein